jgi:hypothetical protein
VQAAAVAAVNDTPQTVVVTGRSANLVGVSDSATDGAITAAQLTNRPLRRPGQLFEPVPGMIVTQHSGDGKVNRYFLPGFNLEAAVGRARVGCAAVRWHGQRRRGGLHVHQEEQRRQRAAALLDRVRSAFTRQVKGSVSGNA